MKQKKLEGVLIAMPTPLLENEDIDTKSLCKLIEYSISEGANGIMMAGTMGEGPALIDSQKQLLLEVTVQHVAGRIPVMATVSATSTRRGLEYVKGINKIGVDYIVCTSPYYYKFPDPESLLIHIQRIADMSSVPLIFYNASGFTGNSVNADTSDKILNMENVAGIKDSSGNYRDFIELLRRYPDKNDRPGSIIQGDESLFDFSLLMGADGIISGGGISYIKLLLKLFAAGVSYNKSEAMRFQTEFNNELLELLYPNPQRNWVFNIKNKLAQSDLIQNSYVSAPFLINDKVGKSSLVLQE